MTEKLPENTIFQKDFCHTCDGLFFFTIIVFYLLVEFPVNKNVMQNYTHAIWNY